MRANEFTIVEKKRRKRRKNAAYGPGPFGGYGYAAGYSGDGGVGEASYPGNIGMMEVAKFFKIANDAQKKLFKELLEKGKRGLAWKLVQDVTGTELQGQEFKEDQEFNEGVDTNSAIKSIVATADSITKVYRDMKAMAENMYDNTGKLKGFKLTSAGIGKRWYDTFFWNRMSSDLYVLLKENPKAAGKLREFFDTLQNDQGHISFSKIEYALPRILNHIGKMLGNSNLENFATNWIKKSEEYHSWLQDLQDKIKDEEEQELEKPASTNKDKTPNIIGQQNSAAEDLVNQILKSLDRRVAGEIRNAIARDGNKLQALQRELAKRNIKLGENFAEGAIDIGSESGLVAPKG